MNDFNTALTKNYTKLSLITVASLSSTLGLRTELAIILNDMAMATWISIIWVFIIIAVLAYYKSKADVELEKFREGEKNRILMGLKPLATYTYTGQSEQVIGKETLDRLNSVDTKVREK